MKIPEAYLFAYFASEKYADGEQIYFAVSQDGLFWEDLNANRPVLISELGEGGVRDPFLIRGKDRFYLIVTDDLDSGIYTALPEDRYRMPTRARQGGVLGITEKEYQALVSHYPNSAQAFSE